MANHVATPLDRTFVALVDPPGRAILARLEREQALSVSEPALPFAIRLPAVMKHLDVLGALQEAMAWLGRYERLWNASLDRLAALAERDTRPRRPKLDY